MAYRALSTLTDENRQDLQTGTRRCQSRRITGQPAAAHRPPMPPSRRLEKARPVESGPLGEARRPTP